MQRKPTDLAALQFVEIVLIHAGRVRALECVWPGRFDARANAIHHGELDLINHALRHTDSYYGSPLELRSSWSSRLCLAMRMLRVGLIPNRGPGAAGFGG